MTGAGISPGTAGRCNLVSGVKEVPMAEPARWIYEEELPELILPEREDGKPWPAQGEWTYGDYLLLPDDGQRYEVIGGVLYVTPAPRYKHQRSAGKFYLFLGSFVTRNGLGEVLFAPFDIKLPAGITNPVEPDIIFFRSGNLPGQEDRLFEGIPDLIAEVLSPRIRYRDATVKLQAYQKAGVPEYWMLDPDARIVVVYRLGGDGRYVELCRGGMGDVVWSAVVQGFRVDVADLFPE
ncbi:MAG TPA: Uma2 family endonuclease [Thermoanaerobaculia bacterium]|nr:Uma2 family endonuclease [Thermoanaerobaculia bacterium]